MSTPAAAPVKFGTIAKAVLRSWAIWVVPTVVASALAVVYAVNKPTVWQASQAVWIRDEAGDRFRDIESLKSAVETVLELSRNRKVVSETLAEVGPPASTSPINWPGPDAVESLRSAISVVAPKGTEFGRTEFVYLTVRDQDRQRALKLTESVGIQMERRLQELRRAKAKSLIDQLQNTLGLAAAGLEESTQRLESLEAEVGSDLGELRSLSDSSGDSNLRAAQNQIKGELRDARKSQLTAQEQRRHLQAVVDDPDQLVAMPNRLLEAQPALKRLKDGLVDAQLRTAQLLGTMTRSHPRVVSALAAEDEVRTDLKDELTVALRGLDVELQVIGTLTASLENQLHQVTERLNRLASVRARYANMISDVDQRTQILDKARGELSAAQARQAAADSSSLLTRLDSPQVGNHPLGPGRSAIVAGGAFGGFLIGAGLLVLVAPWNDQRGRRWSDYLGVGRRSSDRKGGRRMEDTRPAADDRSNGRRQNDGSKSAGERREQPRTSGSAERRSDGGRPAVESEPRRVGEPAEVHSPAASEPIPTTKPNPVAPTDLPPFARQPGQRKPKAAATGPLNLTQSLRRLQTQDR